MKQGVAQYEMEKWRGSDAGEALRDDFIVNLAGRDVSKFEEQGSKEWQCGIKEAEIKRLSDEDTKEQPLLLLDDIFRNWITGIGKR